MQHPLFLQYLQEAKSLGAAILETKSLEIPLGGNRVMLSALELDLEYYEKGKAIPLEPGYMERRLPMERPELFQILLAHNLLMPRNTLLGVRTLRSVGITTAA